jgi:cysteine synthase A
MNDSKNLTFFFIGFFSCSIISLLVKKLFGVKEELDILEGPTSLIGNTKIIRIKSLSLATGHDIIAKCEFINPGGSSKDRIALEIVKSLNKPTNIYEGTSGSTGISLAWISKCLKHSCKIFLPSDQAKEKSVMMRLLGADVSIVSPASIVNPEHYTNCASKAASLDPNGYFADQFENIHNFYAHYNNTGPEILRQTQGKIDALVLGAGTGGTLAGCARFLKPRINNLKVIVADPPGSGIYFKVKKNLFYSPKEAETTRKRNQVDTIVEGIGINRMTRNLDMVLGKGRRYENVDDAVDSVFNNVNKRKTEDLLTWVDDAIQVSDYEAVIAPIYLIQACMARYIVENEGLFLGSSSCVNLVACVKLSRKMKNKKKCILTLLPDSGIRHLTKSYGCSNTCPQCC